MPRFRIRSLLILVALVAMLIEANMLWSRSKQYRAKAAFHAVEERKYRLSAREWLEGADRTVRRADADVARALKGIEGTKAMIKRNELNAQRYQHNDTEKKFDDEIREKLSMLLKTQEMILSNSQSIRLSEVESAVRCRGYAEDDLRLAAYHAALARKYRRAASRPWLTVPADPPMPTKVP